ncbi:MAG: hypothetical protein ABIP03_14560, partial [Aquihabitans sp.]
MRPFPIIAAGVAALTLGLAACGSSSPSSSPSAPSPAKTTTTRSAQSSAPTPPKTTTSTPDGAANPNAPEVVAPGDIPDNQVFVAYTPPGAPFSVRVPEGWSRSTVGGVVTFTDKYNSIEIRSQSTSNPPTTASVKADVQAEHAKDSTFNLGQVSTVQRKSNSGILALYEIGSAPNPVTGKSALLAVEHYEFAHNGTTAVLTLSGAKGADNVDPWRAVTDS